MAPASAASEGCAARAEWTRPCLLVCTAALPRRCAAATGRDCATGSVIFLRAARPPLRVHALIQPDAPPESPLAGSAPATGGAKACRRNPPAGADPGNYIIRRK